MSNFPQAKLKSDISTFIKGLMTTNGSNLVEMRETDTEYNGILVPQIGTTILNPSINTHRGRSFIYDELTETGALPNGKLYNQKGDIMQKGSYKQHVWAIPSYGLTYAIHCADYAEKRKPGTTDQFMDFEFLNVREEMRAQQAFDLLNELNLMSVVTTDTPNFLDGGAITPPNYYTEIVGTSRPAATSVAFSGAIDTLPEYVSLIEDNIDELAEIAAEKRRSVNQWVMLCGKNYFNAVRNLEAQVDLAREKIGTDLAQEGVPVMSDANYGNVRWIRGTDGVLYIKYDASIIGTRLIGANDAYLIPQGVQNMFSIELAPALTLDTVNKEAQAMYMWSEESRREAAFEFESNRLYVNRLPQLIRKFTAA